MLDHLPRRPRSKKARLEKKISRQLARFPGTCGDNDYVLRGSVILCGLP